MLEVGQDPSLGVEPLDPGRGPHLGAQHLDGYLLVEETVLSLGQEDGAHTTVAHLADHPVGAERLAGEIVVQSDCRDPQRSEVG